jgi:hypothetical protein
MIPGNDLMTWHPTMNEDVVLADLGKDVYVKRVVMPAYFEAAFWVFNGAHLIVEDVFAVGVACEVLPLLPEGFRYCVFPYGSDDVGLPPVLLMLWAFWLVGSAVFLHGSDASVDSTVCSCFKFVRVEND